MPRVKRQRAMKPPKAIKAFKKGRTTYGGISELSSGALIYLQYHWTDELNKGDKVVKTVSEAAREGTAAWGIATETLRILEKELVDYVGVFVKDTGDIWLTDLGKFLDRETYTAHNWSPAVRHAHRSVKLSHFICRQGRTKIR